MPCSWSVSGLRRISSCCMPRRALILLGTLLWCMPAGAQPTPFKGVVWTIPASIDQAVRDLVDMHAMGADAVLTSVVADSRLLDTADTLGLALFQDLPIMDLPARGLLDTLAATLLMLDDVIRRTAYHPSARHFGLAWRSDTSDARSCEYFARLTQYAHRFAGVKTYYRSYFARDDACGPNVDVVLLDIPAEHDSAWHMHLWGPDTPVGILSAGKPAMRGAIGLLDPSSAESQARFLENHLRQLLAPDLDPYAVFIFRYRDPPGSYRGGYGLRDASGRSRPSWEVVRGFYTGTQDVFAFRLGKAPVEGWSWSILAAWLAFAIVATAMSTSLRFRELVTKSLAWRGYYVEYLRSERGVSTGAAMVALVSQALLSGATVSILVVTLQHEPFVDYLVSAMPTAARDTYERTLEPGFLIFVSVFVFHVTFVQLVAVALKLSGRISFGKALTIIVWPSWITAILPCVVLIIPSLEPTVAARTATIMAFCMGITALGAFCLSMGHYCKLYIQSRGSRAAMGLFWTAVVSFLAWVLWFLDMEPSPSKITFLWHLALRG